MCPPDGIPTKSFSVVYPAERIKDCNVHQTHCRVDGNVLVPDTLLSCRVPLQLMTGTQQVIQPEHPLQFIQI